VFFYQRRGNFCVQEEFDAKNYEPKVEIVMHPFTYKERERKKGDDFRHGIIGLFAGYDDTTGLKLDQRRCHKVTQGESLRWPARASITPSPSPPEPPQSLKLK